MVLSNQRLYRNLIYPSELNIVEPGKQSTSSSQDATERARRSGMTKGTAGAADTGSEYEQGAAGSNK